MDYTQILLRPLISEKATAIKDATNNVTFFVSPSINKIEVKKAVEQAFNVRVESVNIIKKASVARSRFGRANGKVKGKIVGYKKAYVKLAVGDKIEFFEGV